MITNESELHTSDIKKKKEKLSALTAVLQTFLVRSIKDWCIQLGQKYSMHNIFNLVFILRLFCLGK